MIDLLAFVVVAIALGLPFLAALLWGSLEQNNPKPQKLIGIALG